MMIAGGGFAQMAWKLAWERIYPGYPPSMWRRPFPREVASEEAGNPVSEEFYRVTDKAWYEWHMGHEPCQRIGL